MNKQEQVEKMQSIALMAIDISIGDNDYAGSEDKEEAAQYVAEDLQEAGYINGADFVEWLKHSGFVTPCSESIVTWELDEALQEYLKDDGK